MSAPSGPGRLDGLGSSTPTGQLPAVTPAVPAVVPAQREGGRHAAVAPSSTSWPWRATLRTCVQALVGFAPVAPVFVHAAGIDAQIPAVAGGLAVCAAMTRVMNTPACEAWLQRFVPWLAARPADRPADPAT